MLQNHEEKSIGDLFADLTRELSTLVREEVNLAKSEMMQKATSAGKNVGIIAVGGVLAFGGYLVILAFLVAALAKVLPLWAAALIVGLVVIAAAAGLIFKGINGLKATDPVPRRTVETLKEDAQWARQQVK